MSKYLILTYGCQMNVHETEKLAGILENLGYTLAATKEEADIIVLNTCAIRESAEEKICGNIGELKHLKKANKNLIIAVCGCMSQQQGKAEQLKAKFPFLDIILGTHNISKFAELLSKKIESKKSVISVTDAEDIKDRDNMPKHRTSGVNAWVNISYGCNNYCSYCIVPYVRGKETSRPKQDIINEVKQVVKEGYKQVTLLGQNVNSYGNDDHEKFGTFAELLKAVDETPGDFRIKFMTSHPKDLSSEVIDVIAASNKICHYIHLPVQSGSNRILGLMNRKYNTENYLKLIEEARAKINDVQFSSDIIVGFPTEMEEDFQDTINLVKKVGYEQLFTYIYSKRRGTVAEKLEGQVPLAVKKDRIKSLIACEQEIATKISETFVGKILKVLIEDKHPKKSGFVIGSTNNGKAITIKGDTSLIGQFVNVKITGCKLTTLSGELVED